MELLKSFLKSIGTILIVSIVLAIINVITKNESIAYLATYFIFSLLFICKYKNAYINGFKSLKKSLNFKNIISIIFFIFLSFISNFILVNILNSNASNQENILSFINSSPLLIIPVVLIFAPIVEEVIYRLPYKKNKLSIILSTFIFALSHITNISINELFFFISYLFLSISLSIAYFKDENIVLSTITHILNNLISLVLLFI